MQKYKVLTSSVGARANKIFKYGDVVDGSNWKHETLQSLIKGKFLEAVEDEGEQPDKTSADENSDDKDPGDGKVIQFPPVDIPPPIPQNKPDIGSISIEELRLKLTVAGHKYKENASKEDLFKICINNKLFSNP